MSGSDGIELPTEADLVGRLLLPFIAALGLQPSQIALEHRFTLRLGKGERELSGRSDVLLRSQDGTNLFIVEAKAPDEPLADADHRQAVSYARALWPQMAPFTILTNGRETRLFDTITSKSLGQELLPKRWRAWESGKAVAGLDDLTARYEALRYLIGLSSQNVRAFSRGHVTEALALLTTELSHEPPLLDRRVLVRRPDFEERFADFATDHHSAFVLSGSSGVGKTSVVSCLADRLSDEHITLMYLGAHLHGSVADCVADDFHWSFSQEQRLPSICDRLAGLAEESKKAAFILVDGIDESTLADTPQSLSNLCRRLTHYGGKLKLVVSLKPEQWSRFATLQGTASGLVQTMTPSVQDPLPDDAPTERGTAPSFRLDRFSDNEYAEALGRFREAYGFKTQLSGALERLCKEPLWLRLAAEILASDSDQATCGTTHHELLRRYVSARLSKLASEEQRRYAVASAAALARQLLAQSGVRSVHTSLLLDDLNSDAPRQGVNAAARVGLLTCWADHHERRWVRFSHDRLLDYFVAFHVLQLDRVEAQGLPEVLGEHGDRLAFRRALAIVISDESEGTWRGYLEQSLRLLALGEFRQYERVWGALPPTVRHRISPYTPGGIGATYKLLDSGSWSLGLARRAPDQPRARRSEVVGWARGSEDAATFPETDFSFVRPGWSSRFGPFALEQLRDLARGGGLHEEHSVTLAWERVCTFVATNRRAFGCSEETHWLEGSIPIPIGLFPLDLEQVERIAHIHVGSNRYFLERELEEIKRKAGAQPSRPGRPQVVSLRVSPAWGEEARERAEREVNDGHRYALQGESRWEEVARAVALLRSSMGNRLDEWHLPLPERAPTTRYSTLDSLYSKEARERFIERLVLLALDEFAALVDNNCAGLSNQLPVHRTLPVVAVFHYLPADEDERGWPITYSLVPNPGGRSNTAEVYQGSEHDPFGLREPDFPETIRTRQGDLPFVSHGATGREFLFASDLDLPFTWGERSDGCGRGLLVRRWAYRLLLADLDAAVGPR